MVWVIVACAVAVLGAAAFAGLGHLGEMPDAPVNDRPKGYVPEGMITTALLQELRIPRVSTGYAAGAVDGYLANVAAGSALPAEDVQFPVMRGGYDMQIVDELVERPRYERPTPADDPEEVG